MLAGKNGAYLLRCHQQVCDKIVSRRRVLSVSSFSAYQTVAVNELHMYCDKVSYTLFLPFPLNVDGALEMCLIYAQSVRTFM